MQRRLSAFCLLSVASLVFAASSLAAEKSPSYQAALDSINAEEQFQHIEILASPAMDGRRPGTKGGHDSADYLAKHFAKHHLKPVGDKGTYFQRFDAKKFTNLQNVLAILPGSDPKLRDEVIVVGGHYDTFGRGGGKLPEGPLYPGAEDNATGTSTVLELAKAFSKLEPAPKRSILFACWDGEEWGLLGSSQFANNPTVPREHLVAMFNYDMVGQMANDTLLLHCTRTGYGWRRMMSEANDDAKPMRLDFTWGFVKNSDQYSFSKLDIPVMFAITGPQGYVHSPRDTADRVKREGLERISRWSFKVLCELANQSEKPKFRAAAVKETAATEKALFARGTRPGERIGITIVDPPDPEEGVRVIAVASGAPGEKAGFHANDEIVRFNEHAIRGTEELLGAVFTAPQPAALVTVKRPGQEQLVSLHVNLQGTPLGWTIAGEIDDAQPGVVVLTYVLPESPAAQAGLQVGDRIYKVNEQNFTSESDLIAKMGVRPLRLIVEREGRLRTVTLPAKTTPAKKAA